MPNWVYHRMRLTGSPEALEGFIALLKPKNPGDDEAGAHVLDFNVWDPMPAELASEVGSQSHLGDELLSHMDEPWDDFLARHPWCTRLCQALDTKDFLVVGDLVCWAEAQLVEDTGQPLTQAQTALQQIQLSIALGRTRVQCIERYGHADWYSWSIAHWGTKWNCGACEGHRHSANEFELRFETAWNSPEPVLRLIAQTHPALSGSVDYLDEGFGFAGTYRFGADVPEGFEDESVLDVTAFAREVFEFEVNEEDTEDEDCGLSETVNVAGTAHETPSIN
mgnify:CR=1 FL=1